MCGCTTKNSNSFMRNHIHWCQKKDLVNSIEKNSSSLILKHNSKLWNKIRSKKSYFSIWCFPVQSIRVSYKTKLRDGGVTTKQNVPNRLDLPSPSDNWEFFESQTLLLPHQWTVFKLKLKHQKGGGPLGHTSKMACLYKKG